MAKLEDLKVFISYGRKDARELAFKLREDLQAVGYSVWLDVSEIVGGADWLQSIEDAIEHCDPTLALMSPASSESQWCKAEQLRSMRKGKLLIPLQVTPDAEPPLHLEHLNALDFTQSAQYDSRFRDLLSDISAGLAFRPPAAPVDSTRPSPFRRYRSRVYSSISSEEKRNAPAFRRHLRALRAQPWLGARHWWPYFLFAYVDLAYAVQVLEADEMLSPFDRGAGLNGRWDRFVRFYFRPRTPDLFRNEGFRPLGQSADSLAVPLCLLFDAEALILHPESRFSDGDPARTGKTFKTPGYFQELPFEQIYHDSWFMPDEKDEIMRFREAQVLIPERVGLDALQLIWLRSAAEYETLRSLLPAHLWRKWRDKITTRSDYHLFNNKRVYVEQVLLRPDSVQIRFNMPQRSEDSGPFDMRATLTPLQGGPALNWRQDASLITQDLSFELPAEMEAYQFSLYLDDELAYSGTHMPDLQVL